MTGAQLFSFTGLAAALVLVGLALLLSRRQHLDIEKEAASPAFAPSCSGWPPAVPRWPSWG